MAELGIFDEPREKYVQFDEDTEVLIRFIGKEELTKMNQKADKTANLTGADKAEIFNQRLGRAAVRGWRKMSDHGHPGLMINGKPLPYTSENVDMLMRKCLEFATFVNDNSIKSRLFLEKEKEDEESKNA